MQASKLSLPAIPLHRPPHQLAPSAHQVKQHVQAALPLARDLQGDRRLVRVDQERHHLAVQGRRWLGDEPT
jgi:hypothetical protein